MRSEERVLPPLPAHLHEPLVRHTGVPPYVFQKAIRTIRISMNPSPRFARSRNRPGRDGPRSDGCGDCPAPRSSAPSERPGAWRPPSRRTETDSSCASPASPVLRRRSRAVRCAPLPARPGTDSETAQNGNQMRKCTHRRGISRRWPFSAQGSQRKNDAPSQAFQPEAGRCPMICRHIVRT